MTDGALCAIGYAGTPGTADPPPHTWERTSERMRTTPQVRTRRTPRTSLSILEENQKSKGDVGRGRSGTMLTALDHVPIATVKGQDQ